jgi:hypothetical protein
MHLSGGLIRGGLFFILFSLILTIALLPTLEHPFKQLRKHQQATPQLLGRRSSAFCTNSVQSGNSFRSEEGMKILAVDSRGAVCYSEDIRLVSQCCSTWGSSISLRAKCAADSDCMCLLTCLSEGPRKAQIGQQARLSYKSTPPAPTPFHSCTLQCALAPLRA